MQRNFFPNHPRGDQIFIIKDNENTTVFHKRKRQEGGAA
jgi:hypothetical protein